MRRVARRLDRTALRSSRPLARRQRPAPRARPEQCGKLGVIDIGSASSAARRARHGSPLTLLREQMTNVSLRVGNKGLLVVRREG